VHNEPLSIVAMSVSNPDRSPARIQHCQLPFTRDVMHVSNRDSSRLKWRNALS
jgi:hypothetical protein